MSQLTRRSVSILVAGAAALVSVLAAPPAALPLQGPPPAVREAISSVVRMLEASGDASLESFAEERLDPGYRGSFEAGELLEHLRSLRETARGSTGELAVEREDDGLVLVFAGEREVRILVDLDEANGRFRRLELLDVSDAGDGGARAASSARERALEGLVSGAESYGDFAAEHLTRGLRERLGEEALHDMLSRIADGFARASSIGLRGGPEGITIELRAGMDMDVHYRLEDEAPWRIDELSIDTDVAPEGADDPDLVFTWDDLDAQLVEAEEQGFAGTVLAIRDGEVVLDESYGLADPATGRPNTAETIYDIGSVPFDFTRGAVYLLAQRGELSFDDSIAEYLPDVPADKRAITIEHLLTGRSGLPNFHGRPEDVDRDLSWISREEAERRILEGPLLFDPGSDQSPSHSAYGLLAAIVERITGSYAEFLRENFFAEAGMERTGFYGEDLGHGPEQFAVGPAQQVSDPNIPPEWGPASWLVIGSGGMVSTPADLRRWLDYLRDGGVLEGRWREGYLGRRAATGGSDRGFMAVTAWDGDDSMIYVASNSGGRPPTRAVVMGLRRLAVSGGE